MAYRRRNSLRAKGHVYGAGYYAVVILTAERQRFFGEIVGQTMQVSELGDVVLQMWLRIPEIHPHVTLDEFQIMPDHFHGILILDEKYQHMNGSGVGKDGAGALSDALTRVGAGEGGIHEKRTCSNTHRGAGGDTAVIGKGEAGVGEGGAGVGEGEAGALSDALTRVGAGEGGIQEKSAFSDVQTGVGGDGSGVGEGGAGALSDALTSAGPVEVVIREKIALSDVQTGVGGDGSGVGEGEAGEGEDGAGALSDALTSEQSRRARQFKAGSLSAIINSFKASVSTVAHREFPHLPIKIWHRSFFDTIIRDERHLNNMRQYIRNNIQHWQE